MTFIPCANSVIEVEPKEDEDENKFQNRQIVWTARAKGSVRVSEEKRTVEAYMALPASQYSILSAEQIVSVY